jgi:hypothetical protein
MIVIAADQRNISIAISREQLRVIQLSAYGLCLDEIAEQMTDEAKGMNHYTTTEVFSLLAQFHSGMFPYLGLLPPKKEPTLDTAVDKDEVIH